MLENLCPLEINTEYILLNDEEVPYSKLKSKQLYFQILYPLKPPNCIPSWSNMFNHEIDWSKVCKTMNSSIHGRKQRDLHWKIIHNAVYTESRLHHMNRSNGMCKVCNLHLENISHLFYECQKIHEVWNQIADKIESTIEQEFQISLEHVIFGDIPTDDMSYLKYHQYIANLYIYETKWQIWKNRNSVRYGGKQSLSVEDIINTVKEACIRQAKLFNSGNDNKQLRNKLKQYIDKILNEI